MSDYLAIIQTNGIGSWARGPEKLTAINDVVRIFRADWKTILKPKDKKPKVTVCVYDVEGYDQVVWDEINMYGDGKKLDIVPEMLPHTYDKWK